MTMSGAELVFWVAAALLGYTYVGYPAIAVWIARKQSARAAIAKPDFRPDVAVLIAAFNEQAHIAERIGNVLAQDYPPDRLHAVIGSDGSTDDTARIARHLAGTRAHVHVFESNRGKASVLNDLVTKTSQDVIIFSDANTRFETDTVARLVAPLADPAIGAVCGELILTPPDGSRNEDHRYWTLERRLKAAESTFDGLLGANGGVYAIRRSSYRPLSPDTICDDFVIVMNVAVEGLRVVYEPLARAHEETPHDMQAELVRRIRIGLGNYQSLFKHPEFLTSTRRVRAWTYVSHKALRWLTPHLLLALLAASFAALPHPGFAALLAAQLAVYAGACLVYVTEKSIEWPTPLRSATLFFVVNAAFGVAFLRFLSGGASGRWARTERGPGGARR